MGAGAGTYDLGSPDIRAAFGGHYVTDPSGSRRAQDSPYVAGIAHLVEHRRGTSPGG